MFIDRAQRLFNELQKNLPDLSNHFPKEQLDLALQSALAKLNLVTREEFDAQAAVLLRTREKLERIEQQLKELDPQKIESDKQDEGDIV